VRLLVPIRYPLTRNSRKTLERAAEIKRGESSEKPVDVHILHVDLIQDSKEVRREDLRREVKSEFDLDATYVVRRGFLVEETILEEAGRKGVDMVLIGKTRSSRLRRVFDRLVSNNPDIEAFLRDNLDVTIEVVD
jgi:nucleotide-binding universal stress UspA family protein